jgi:hypothetical protein
MRYFTYKLHNLDKQYTIGIGKREQKKAPAVCRGLNEKVLFNQAELNGP